MSTVDDGSSTLAAVRPSGVRPWVKVGRRGVLAVLVLVVLAGAAGLLGVRTATATTDAEGWSMRLEYPQVARAGLDTTWRVSVRHPGGFGGEPIVLAVSARYFDIFETQAFHPEPSATTSDGRMIFLSFDPPAGDRFAVDYDAYIQPASQLGRRAQLWLMDGPQPRLRLSYRTWLLP